MNTGMLTPNQLMQKAAHKFKILKSKDLWEAPSAQDVKITALESVLTDMKQKLKQFKEGKKRGNKDGRNERPKKQKYFIPCKKLYFESTPTNPWAQLYPSKLVTFEKIVSVAYPSRRRFLASKGLRLL